jgi:enoyl-CoA hydratase/carnithine racemase
MIRDMRSIPKPIIACVNGLACGAGGGLALGADLRFASDSASFADIFIRRGIAGGAYLLTQTVGTAKALELMFTGDFIDAQEASPARSVQSRCCSRQADGRGAGFRASAWRMVAAQALGHSKLAAYGVAQLPLNEGLRVEELAKLCCLRGSEVQEGIASPLTISAVRSFGKERG